MLFEYMYIMLWNTLGRHTGGLITDSQPVKLTFKHCRYFSLSVDRLQSGIVNSVSWRGRNCSYLTSMHACTVCLYLSRFSLNLFQCNNNIMVSRKALYLSSTGSYQLTNGVPETCTLHPHVRQRNAQDLTGGWLKCLPTACTGVQWWVKCLMIKLFIMSTVMMVLGFINLFAGVCLASACIWSSSMIQIHVNMPQNQGLWMRSCGNCVDVSSNFPQSDSRNKSSMSNFLKFS